MKFQMIAAGLALAVLSACGTRPYVPSEYPLRAGLIPPLPTSGEVTFKNASTDTAQTIVSDYGGTSMASDYKAMTQLMVDQATRELAKAKQAKGSGKAKTIDLKILSLKTHYIAFSWGSQLTYSYSLGGAAPVDKTFGHGAGDPVTDLNGAIAKAVQDLLNDPKVQAYLAE